MISDQKYQEIYDKSQIISREYLNTHGYSKVETSSGLDKLILQSLKDYKDAKIDDFTLSTIFAQFEANPLHHFSKYKEPLHLGINLDFYIIEENSQKSKETKDLILNWLKTNHPSL